MKKVLFSLVLFVIGTMSMQAQEKLSSGYLKMEIKEVGSENEQIAASLEMMKGTQTEIFFTKDKNLSKMSMMGGIVETTTLVNSSTGNSELLFNAMGQKFHVASTKAERDAMANQQAELMKNLKVTYDESDTRTILGYKCTKATFSSPEMAGLSFTMYVTKDIAANVDGIQMVENLNFEGFPLLIEMENPQMNMTIEAVELKKDIDMSVFDLDKTGYQSLTMKEFTEKMGAMGGGGLGF